MTRKRRLTLTLAMAVWGLLRSRPWDWEGADGPAVLGFAFLASAGEEQEGGRPPVAWAAASRAEMEDIGSEPDGAMSRPAARAASIREEELVMEGFLSPPRPPSPPPPTPVAPVRSFFQFRSPS